MTSTVDARRRMNFGELASSIRSAATLDDRLANASAQGLHNFAADSTVQRASSEHDDLIEQAMMKSMMDDMLSKMLFPDRDDSTASPDLDPNATW